MKKLQLHLFGYHHDAKYYTTVYRGVARWISGCKKSRSYQDSSQTPRPCGFWDAWDNPPYPGGNPTHNFINT